jgi:hypothetical protein
MLIRCTALALVIGVAAFAHAGFSYDESTDGDLPHPNEAFLLPFGTPNPNTVRFETDTGSDGWVLQVDPGETLRSFTMMAYLPNNPSYTATFHMYDGATQDDPVLGTPYSSFGGELLGVDFLDHYGIGPLGPGQYLFNFWHDNSYPNYPTMQFDINMTGESPVEATTWAAIRSLYR